MQPLLNASKAGETIPAGSENVRNIYETCKMLMENKQLKTEQLLTQTFSPDKI